jgi:GNAT superfamily N-acetyltransferase
VNPVFPVMTRPAGIADAPAIAMLTAQLGYDATVEDVTSRLARLLARNDMRFIVAEHDGALVGWVHVEIAEYVEASAFAVIGGLVVNRAHRRQGIGAALMAEAESWARAQGCALMRLWSSVPRASAHRFYESLGYTNLKTQYSFAKALDARGEVEARRLVPRVDPTPA